ncbi:murein L,D-transpeptidase catalytic domain-containing protein [Niabella hibiscisoli]|uniref:murein L,D-transpeptidase catalytic domain-containing protein n=1 Tax=Niabella hibiscisoli TaxID=1825928 RepID=UPI001F0FD345|nr:murein L,D-transpeptidase catalytic domain family protein [Niabella hibiscisoli]MCH5721440.1 murein L,D-transpeptidase catalytic domain family protein [Niabella hibiscisoli]
MKYKFLLAACLVGGFMFTFNSKQHNKPVFNSVAAKLIKPVQPAVQVIAGKHIDSVKQFVKLNKYNSGICFFIDMSLPSGSNRFFIYDLNKDSIINAGLVTHGNCYQYWLEGRKYSNKIGSGCTSLGKYKIGKPYYGKFGLAYKLYGLDETNDNALKRFVVMHSHACVPDEETKGDICQSNGCPTVSPSFLAKLQAIVDKSPRPMLLYIYE